MQEPTYIDTPKGIFTSGGIWFRTTEKALDAYAAPVFARVPLPRLLGLTEVWMRSARTLALWLLPFFLFMVEPLPAALAALTIYIGWRSLSPPFVHPRAASALSLLDHVVPQALYYLVSMSYLATQEEMAAMWTGLGGFILLRWGIVERLTEPLVRVIHRSLFTLPEADQILRMLIVRTALAHHIALPEIDRMEEDIRDHISRSR